MNKVIFRIAIGLLIFWVISPILLNLIGLEFNDNGLEQSFETVRFFGVPICIILTLFGTVKKSDRRGDKIMKIGATLSVGIFAFFFMIISIFTGMCDWSNQKILYTNKKNKEVKIIKRDYGCGATDSDLPTIKIFKVRKVTKYFILAKEVDITKIDQNEWNKTEE